MTDLLDAPEAREDDAVPEAAPDVGAAPTPAASPGALSPGGRWLLAACLAGAGAIHVAMAPSHMGESAVEGWGFVLAAWAQLALAAAVLVRPSRRVGAAVVMTSVALIAVGERNQAIADQLFISLPTVRKHRENLMRKLDLHNAAELTAFAIRTGLLSPR